MSSIRQHTATLLLPTVFFGYAIYANSTMLFAAAGSEAEAAQVNDLSLSYVIDGEATRDLDALYKSELPHRDAAVGVIGNARYALLGSGRKGVIVGDDGWFFTGEEFKRVKPTDIESAVNQIGEIRKKLAAAGIELVMVPLPAKSDIYTEHLPDMMRNDAMVTAYGDFSTALSQAGMTVVDTRTAMLAAKPKDEVFLKSDTHWTPAGARATAEAVQNTFRQSGILLASEQVTASWETPVDVWGDLTKYITSPDYAPRVGLTPESVPIYRASVTEAEGSEDIFGSDASVPVMLVGTSYSANENWSFADFLRQTLSTDVVNVAKEGLGPGVPMMDLLEGQVLTDTPPSVIVWEFPVRYLGTDTLWTRKTNAGNGGHHGPVGEGNV
ncbi:alginate O-acetyltransferase [Rhizobium sp. SL42]|uniref:alginate O-acetyltransferase n=1 Tax=Rhizobium sp. SL42 TaxID=2806346 RepID=UPI001F278FD1|nr:alginate O-acetyltransferase [Rhizobium sp. SL42]UJW74934.1 alginate O-acetyltransferase [Rhizobium sp. SL42]